MLTAVLKAVKMLLSCCPKNSQDVAVLAALKAVQDAEKNHPHKDQVQRLIPIRPLPWLPVRMSPLDRTGILLQAPHRRLNHRRSRRVVPIATAREFESGASSRSSSGQLSMEGSTARRTSQPSPSGVTELHPAEEGTTLLAASSRASSSRSPVGAPTSRRSNQ
jgi:hypothetical protein